MKTEVSLDDYRTDGCKVFSGHERGRLVAIDIKETYGDDVDIIIPEDVYSISPTFSRSFNEILPNKLDWKAEMDKRMNQHNS